MERMLTLQMELAFCHLYFYWFASWKSGKLLLLMSHFGFVTFILPSLYFANGNC